MMDHSKLQYIGTYTRQPMRVEWPLDAAGLVVNYVARWINSKGEEGPWSVPLPMQIAFGGVGLQCGSGSGGSRGTAQIEQVRPVRRAA